MTSQELNAALAEFDLQTSNTPYEELWAKWDELNLDGLPVPFMGWFWRHVDFDRACEKGYSFGVDPRGRVAFMESNKWGFATVKATPQQMQEIRAAIEKAITSKQVEDFLAVHRLLQALVL